MNTGGFPSTSRCFGSEAQNEVSDRRGIVATRLGVPSHRRYPYPPHLASSPCRPLVTPPRPLSDGLGRLLSPPTAALDAGVDPSWGRYTRCPEPAARGLRSASESGCWRRLGTFGHWLGIGWTAVVPGALEAWRRAPTSCPQSSADPRIRGSTIAPPLAGVAASQGSTDGAAGVVTPLTTRGHAHGGEWLRWANRWTSPLLLHPGSPGPK